VPEILYRPSRKLRERSRLAEFIGWLATARGVEVDGYDALHAWSITEIEAFWTAVWDYFEVHGHTPATRVLSGTMPDARWFEGATLNYAEHCLGADPASVALVGCSQTREPVSLTFGDLAEQVRRARNGLRRLGVTAGDRVVAYAPNIPETVVAFLAAASLGAVWASVAPEFGAPAVVDRLGQLEPSVLITVGGYRFGAKPIDKAADVAAVRAGLPTLKHVVSIPYGDYRADATVSWSELLDARDETPLAFDPVPFEHPLYVLFSSGTTGVPKPITHGHGGILLEHLKNHALHWDLRPGDRLLWFTTTAWMMWNALVSSLLVGAAAVLIDGNPAYPGLDAQWRLAAETGATVMGAAPGYLMACRDAGLTPARTHDLSRVRQIGVAGSPLPPEGFAWIHDQFGDDVLLNVGSGGTDVCTGLVQGSALQPVWRGAMSGPSLGVDARAYDERGNPVVGELGELVIRRPMPSMPVGFWGDAGRSRYRDAYFDVYPGIWRHGDWVRFAEDGSCVITGRSDATLNRGGVRLGTAEFYRVVEELPGVADSLVVHLEDEGGGPGQLILFVVARDDVANIADLEATIVSALRTSLTPRHVPDHVELVPAVPRTGTGKKLEVPVKRILQGHEVASHGSLDDPGVLEPYFAFARRYQ
jgi:acetoacetyl-CoA synthetase